MQTQIMLFFQSISSPLLDTVGEFATWFGEQTVFIFITAYLLWCMNKQKGFTIFSTLFVSLFTMNALKAIIRQPRPFMVIEQLEGKRLETATGYSFPSGHSTGAASFYSSLAYLQRRRWLSIICAVLILLVGVSRIYLRVHWPLDVFAGITLGIVVTLLLAELFGKLYQNKGLLIGFSYIVGIVSTVAGLILAFLISAHAVDEVAFGDMMKLLALGSGGYIGFAIEESRIHYATDGTFGIKLLRFAIGIIVIVLIQAAKAVLPEHMVFSFLRYALTGAWATVLYPYLGRHVKLGKHGYLFTAEAT